MMMDIPVAAQVNGPSTTTVDEDECEVCSVIIVVPTEMHTKRVVMKILPSCPNL